VEVGSWLLALPLGVEGSAVARSPAGLPCWWEPGAWGSPKEQAAC